MKAVEDPRHGAMWDGGRVLANRGDLRCHAPPVDHRIHGQELGLGSVLVHRCAAVDGPRRPPERGNSGAHGERGGDRPSRRAGEPRHHGDHEGSRYRKRGRHENPAGGVLRPRDGEGCRKPQRPVDPFLKHPAGWKNRAHDQQKQAEHLHEAVIPPHREADERDEGAEGRDTLREVLPESPDQHAPQSQNRAGESSRVANTMATSGWACRCDSSRCSSSSRATGSSPAVGSSRRSSLASCPRAEHSATFRLLPRERLPTRASTSRSSESASASARAESQSS